MEDPQWVPREDFCPEKEVYTYQTRCVRTTQLEKDMLEEYILYLENRIITIIHQLL